MSQDWAGIRAAAGRQHGLIGRQQALDAGFSASGVDRLAVRGVLHRPAPRVLTAVSPDTHGHLADLWLAHLSIRRMTVVSHLSALWLWGLLRFPPNLTWLTVQGKWAPQRPGVRVVATRSLPPEDVDSRHGLPCTTPARTLVDLAAFMPKPKLRGVMLDARQRRLTDECQVAEVAERRNGAKGRSAVLRLCSELAVETADSELEYKVREWLQTTPLPPPAPDPLIIPTPGGDRQLDIPWPDYKVGLDCDGLAYHGSRTAHDKDAVRRTDINLTVWRTLFVTWARLELGAPRLLRDIELALQLGSRPSA